MLGFEIVHLRAGVPHHRASRHHLIVDCNAGAQLATDAFVRAALRRFKGAVVLPA
jgi:hypothetical protein